MPDVRLLHERGRVTPDYCVCGHPMEDHHTSWFAFSGQKIIEECENVDCLVLPRVEQCQHYRPDEESWR